MSKQNINYFDNANKVSMHNICTTYKTLKNSNVYTCIVAEGGQLKHNYHSYMIKIKVFYLLVNLHFYVVAVFANMPLNFSW